MKFFTITFALIGLMFLSGCSEEVKQARGFSLPTGDVSAGEMVFLSMQCNSCHSLPGIEQQSLDGQRISVELGGEVTRIKTYGELVTSVINPSHRIARIYEPQNTDEQGRSNMRNYNDVLTVTQLVDLVSFLQDQYQLKEYEPSEYRSYYP